MPMRPCIVCGTISDQTRCPTHRRGTTAQRSYGAEHQRERAAWAPLVAQGGVKCRRAPFGLCVADQPLIQPGESWHLGHPDAVCPAPKAPEHVVCNAGAPRRT
ncbi:MAG TPA: hypothetical protein VF049_08390 [Nocardioidaceae bacterium]|jgi:hypothetical protein